MEPDLHYLSLTEVAWRMRRRKLSPVELTRALLDRIDTCDGVINSYITVTSDRALAHARQAEEEIGRGLHRGPLHGVPVALKDLIDTSFAPTTAGMGMRADFVPSEDATVVKRLEAGGAVILGKLALTEGAYAAHHPKLRTPVNPWSREHWTGASSSGSGAAAASGLCFAALGSDTGGSIRLPTSACGLTGMKPTWGRVSRHGTFDVSPSLDHIGPMARNAADVAATMQVIAGADPFDATTLQAPVPNYVAALQEGVSGVRIGLDMTLLDRDVDPEVSAVVSEAGRLLATRGARIAPVAMPSSDTLLSGWPGLCVAEARLSHSATYPSRAAEYGPALAAVLDRGERISGLELAARNIELLHYSGRLAAIFEDVDLLLIPVIPFPTPRADSFLEIFQRMGSQLFGRFTTPFNMTGHPTITLQGGVTGDGLPIGFQIVAPNLGEARLFAAAHAYQEVSDWHTRHPEVDV